ncbi:flagellar biosynthesis anti-sigma factor FlgM [Oceanisphaera pacifica]|uniref:Negative regulator of flagellin synthesis n=1 Tax=Oceanisphaera pacifica TaxID=2818389 RepID=A0ABS3NHC6_9GAMM|nr:flagellar biosynthesis anti-sigma factor FlgM [Oceanisphaera pacifica]MBO1519972.1 flagellar biosynthesis anti-sigma factor FlgM [Oceanisphaera pacifica]
MAIDKLPTSLGNSTPLANNKYKQNIGNEAAPSAAKNTVATTQDSVTLTPQAQRLSQVQHNLANTSAPDNSAKIEALKKAINEGTYQIDSDKLAANISSFEQDLEGL